MKNKQLENSSHTKANSHLHALDVSILLASSFFWAWYQLAILSSTLFIPFDTESSFDIYRSVAIFSTVASLLFLYKKEDLAMKLLNSRRWEIIFVSMAVVGGGMTMIGALGNSYIAIIIGGIIVGSTAIYFMLAWSRMYSRRGSRSTATSITGAFAVSFCLAILVSTMDPLAGAIITTLFPILVVLVLIGVQSLFYSTTNPNTDVSNALQENPDVAFGATDVLVKSRDKTEQAVLHSQARKQEQADSSKISLALTLAFVIFGFSFGYDIFSGPHHSLSLLVMISGALTGLIFFVITFLKPEWLYGALLAGILAGIASYILVPSLALESVAQPLTEMLTTIGSVSFFTTSWTLLADMTIITKRGSTTVFIQGLFRCYIGILLGYLFGIATQHSALSTSLSEASLVAILGFVFVIGLLFLFVGNHDAWKSLRISLSHDSKTRLSLSNTSPARPIAIKEHVSEIAQAYRLTEREKEILELLATGRSRTRIAQALYVSENTVNTHVQHIYRKMEVKNIQELLDFVL